MTSGERRASVLDWAKSSLQRQFALIAAALVVIASGVFLLLVSQQYRASILNVHEQASVNVNLLLQAALENAMIKRDLDGLQDIVARLGKQNGVTGVMITDPSGEVRFSSYPDKLFDVLTDDDFVAAAATGERRSGFRIVQDGQEALRSINPVHNQERCTGCHGSVAENPINGLLIVDYDSSDVRETVQRGTLLLAALGFIVLLLLEAGLWLALHRLVLSRLGQLSSATRAFASGDLTVRAGTKGTDELAQLGGRFDGMADQLEDTIVKLKSAHASLQALIDAIPDGVRVIGPDYRILMANKAYCRQIGADPAQVAGAACYTSSHKRDTPCVPTLVRCPVVAILEQGQTDLTCRHQHIDAEGAELSVEVSAAPVCLTEDGHRRTYVVEAIRDLERDLSISHKQRLAELGNLAAGVAHEVNNPLSSIALALKSIQSKADLSPEMIQYLEVAETEIENCRAITESLLRLSELPRAEKDLVDLSDAITGTVSLLRFEAGKFGVSIELAIEGRPRVFAQDSDIRNLVFNLALNAIHAMPQGGRLRIACRTEGDMVRLEVADTGVGIPERDQGKILLPFWTRRADGSRGRGLGLAICASIVKNNAGTLSFDSKVGEGTCFRVGLPNAGEGVA